MKIEQIFSTPFFSTSIDPLSYNKKEIVDTVYTNYKKNPYLNEWDYTESNLHHYYNANINENFNLEPLYQVYEKVINKIFNNLFSFKMDYVYDIANITAYTSHQHMKVHDHAGAHGFFAGVHYIKVPKKCSPLKLFNPLVYGQYPNNISTTLQKKFKDQASSPLLGQTSSPLLSAYIQSIHYEPAEDSIVFFPSYLKHAVYPSSHEKNDNEELRIAAVINVLIGDDIPRRK